MDAWYPGEELLEHEQSTQDLLSSVWPTIERSVRKAKMDCILSFYQAGLEHWDEEIRGQFWRSLELAARALQERASEGLVLTAALYHPCHMLPCRIYHKLCWTSDSLIESGTLDWLTENFGESVAEVIRLQSHVNRYLASINAEFRQALGRDAYQDFCRSGGEMSHWSKLAFSRNRYFSPAMQLARCVHLTRDRICEDRL